MKPLLIVESDPPASLAATYDLATRSDDWQAFRGRACTLWPAPTLASVSAFRLMADALVLVCPTVRLLDVADGVAPDPAWDAARWEVWASNRVLVLTQGPTVVSVQTEDAGEATQTQFDRCEALGLAMTRAKQPICNAANIVRLLTTYPPFAAFCWYDEFYHEVMLQWPGESAQPRSDAVLLRLLVFLQGVFGFHKLSRQAVEEAVTVRATSIRRHVQREWLDSLRWDGTARLAHLFADHFGAPQNEYTEAVALNFFIGLVARLYKPGCQMDSMLILVGPQGIGKSQALRILGGTGFTETALSMAHNRFTTMLQGKWLVCLSELASWRRAEFESIKHLLTATTDRLDLKYIRYQQDFPRQCVFAATTNTVEHLPEEEGLRRFWTIACGEINLPALAEARVQLFAEAVALYRRGTSWWALPPALLAETQARHKTEDPFEGPLRGYLQGVSAGVELTITELAAQALNIPVERITRSVQVRIGRVMQGIDGWEQKQNKRPRYYVYLPEIGVNGKDRLL